MENRTEELLKIGVIGMGNCGGQMANLASKYGFSAIAINASEKDLGLLDSESIVTIPVGDGKGTGKNRDEAAEFFLNRINMVQDPVVSKFVDSSDVIVVASSIGGGFGSGSSLILVDVLNKMTGGSKVIIPAGVIPFDDESYTAQNHAIAWLKELMDMDLSYLLYDNNIFKSIPKKEAHVKINEQFVMDLKVIRGDMILPTTSGGIDNRDMLTAISIPGRIVVDAMPLFEAADVVDDSIVKTIRKHIKDESAHAEMVDDKVIKASALMYTLRDEFNTYKPNLKTEVQEEFGVHLNDYDNFVDLDDTEDSDATKDSVAIILTGLSAPNLRIDRLISKRDKLEADILGQKTGSSKLANAGVGSDILKVRAKSFADPSADKKTNTADFLAGYVANRKK